MVIPNWLPWMRWHSVLMEVLLVAVTSVHQPN
jgi:hypothetical protein